MSTHPRPIASLENDYEMYGHTRETTRLRTEYDLHSAPKPSKKPVTKLERAIAIVRIVLRTISFLLAASIVAILGYSIWLYQSTKDDDVEDEGGAERTVWVSNMKLRPNYVVLAIACIATVLSLAVLIAMMTKQTYRRVNNVSNLTTAVVSCIGALLWFGVGVWYRTGKWGKSSNLDMTNYVCQNRHIPSLHSVIGNMDGLCEALQFAFAATLFAFPMELFSSATVGLGVMAAKKGGTYAKV